MLVNPHNVVDLGGRDPYEIATEYMDKLLLLLHDYGDNKLSDFYREVEPDSQKRKVLLHVLNKITQLMTKEFVYIEMATPTTYQLTPHGRYVKSVGGHFAYLKILDEQMKEQLENK